jgi:hypothetical protein
LEAPWSPAKPISTTPSATPAATLSQTGMVHPHPRGGA